MDFLDAKGAVVYALLGEGRMNSENVTISIAIAADESYSVALCVAVYTLLEKLRPGINVDLYILASDVRTGTRRQLEKTWGARVQPYWISPEAPAIRTLVTSIGHTSHPAVYYRLFIGSLLPAGLAKVIYLDADVMVQGDIYPLWSSEMNGNIVLAVQDSCIQTYRRHRLLEGSRSYFNSGVMVIDLSAWRREGIEQYCIKTARDRRRFARYNEQEALNHCLSGRWGLLAPIWNRQSTIDLFPDCQSSPYSAEEFQQSRRNPAIIHFTTTTKPWQAICDHSRFQIDAYKMAILRAGWTGWTPPSQSAIQMAIEFFARPHRRLLHLGSAVKQAKRRRHAIAALLPEMLKLAVSHPWILFSVPLAAMRDTIALRLIR
jgi:lipopolysaccharide biosynthesis glycosyltransferase